MKSSVTILKCDRCGATAEDRTGHECYVWGRIHVEQVNGPLGIGRGGQKPKFLDVCHKCLKDVCTWFDNPKSTVTP